MIHLQGHIAFEAKQGNPGLCLPESTGLKKVSFLADMKRILVADDAEVVTTLLVSALEVKGYEVVVANNGRQAYDLGVDQEFDLAIVDQLMPGLLGSEILLKWRENGVTMPAIVLSGVEDDDLIVGMLEMGVDFVRKPFRLPELLARINRHFS